MYRKFFKRFLDVVFSASALIIFAPLLLVITIFLCFANKGKPFFTQRRPGKDCKVFLLVKFKTMNDKKDAYGNLLSDEQRITNIGKFIRKTSIDELLQLLNVLKGNMSLVGPRPLLIQYLHLYTPEQNLRHTVKPGITGWAQVNGRNAISWEQKFKLDVWYASHVSFKIDMKIVAATIFKVFKSQDISQDGHATMPYFTGTN